MIGKNFIARSIRQLQLSACLVISAMTISSCVAIAEEVTPTKEVAAVKSIAVAVKSIAVEDGAKAAAKLSEAAAATVNVTEELVLTGGAAAPGYIMMIGDAKFWDQFVGSAPIASASGFLNVHSQSEAKIIDASWNGKGEAQLFLANEKPRDFTKFLKQDSKLVISSPGMAKIRP